MKCFAFVFARGGSKGVPGKNIRHFVDRPLLAHAIGAASKVSEIERTFVSTDSQEIADIAQVFGATVIPRPPELAKDESPEWLSWKHAIQWVRQNIDNFECFVSLPTTSPMRLPVDVRQCILALEGGVDVVLTITQAQRNPWFNMVKKDAAEYLSLLVSDKCGVIRRQDAPQAFDLTTLAYVARPDFIMGHESLWQGKVRGVLIPQERSIDIDTEYDFRVAEFLMRERLRVEK